MLAIKGLKVVRGSFMVYLPHLTINDGECVALCGVSGSGKSTLLEAIGLLTPCLSVEHFSLNGINVDELDPHDAQALRVCDIGIMPQSGGLVPYLTIRENLQLQITLALKQQVYPLFPEHVDAAPQSTATALSFRSCLRLRCGRRHRHQRCSRRARLISCRARAATC